jgi:hypothetical protein
VIERFLKDQLSDIKVGALKNLHIFLAEISPEHRSNFIRYIVDTYNEAQYDWRTKLVIA